MPDTVVAKVHEIPEGEAKLVSVGDVEIAVFNCDGVWRAVNNQCPHRGGPLAEGFMEDGVVTCPWHGWEIDLESGSAKHRAELATACYAVRADGDDVVVTTP